MSICHTPRFRLSCLAALLSLSGQSNSALPEPRSPENNYDWTDGNLYVNSAYALGVSHWNILRYYDEARVRYGALPPQDQLIDAAVGWDTYLASNVPSFSIYVGMVARNNNPPNNGGVDSSYSRNPLG